jgi:ComF family protein
MAPLAEPMCEICSLPLDDNGICDRCRTTRPQYRALRSCAIFEEPVRNVLHRVKYQSDLGLGESMAFELAKELNKYAWEIELIVPMPLSKQREFDRGYNQAAIFAYPLALLTGIPYSRQALKKAKDTISQVKLNAEQRRENVRGVFQAQPRLVAGKTILVVDDVATTGASLNEAAYTLREAGAKEVYALTIARALPHHDLQLV